LLPKLIGNLTKNNCMKYSVFLMRIIMEALIGRNYKPLLDIRLVGVEKMGGMGRI
jgi:hypothetical protein